MKYITALTVVLIAGAAVIVAFVTSSVDFANISDVGPYYVFLIMFIFPIVVAFFGILVLAAHPNSFRFSPNIPASKDEDPILHVAIGLLIAILQDLSRGSIAAESMYTPNMRQVLESELQQLRVFFDRGFLFHFIFYHNEAYNAHVVHQLSVNETVVEVDGLFDYFFERGGSQRSSPHSFSADEPLKKVPGLVRLRIHREDGNSPWKIVGFEESLKGWDFGLATH